ncbi:DUF1659 domain-containing protein [Aquibacillus albus]|uniref:DUF1659 domain-containing protein n=1 Tax=Aquibacillus albus TaxID=1168171 RepID=A0ABS2N6P7_9BACI|nr:DUF1659 domain-containing protein [Aquibacillus albus]MBM7573728.1 hypothetical protein [Aquibacillus albus]
MAVATKIDTRLQLVFEDGVDLDTGNTIYKNKTFNNVKTAATPDQLLAITEALVPLQTRTLYSVKQNDSSLITVE